MAENKKLPVGIDDFKKLRQENFYYIDKTGLIADLLDRWAEVNLFTRPRRFGKTLNMSMLRRFFEIGTDPALFDGLKIMDRQDLCDEYMGKYPVIFLSLKEVDRPTYKSARYMLTELVANEAERFEFLLHSERLSETEKARYKSLVALQNGKFTMDEDVLCASLQLLSKLLYSHYGKKAIILIDEYDVPLDKAFQNGYYQEMVSLMRTFLGAALKTNSYLQMAVLTGCLRISKESIFTGLNNFKVLTITDTRFEEHFGFTDAEVQHVLADYDRMDHYEEVKEWYDGYRFGDANIYCPWDVINYVDLLQEKSDAEPQAFWINSSGNALVKRFVGKADKMTRGEIERLIAGEAIRKKVRQELTYGEIDNSIDNLWSVLFTTGYLTTKSCQKHGEYDLVIPNKEVREVFIDQIQEWFKETILQNAQSIKELSTALLTGQETEVEKHINSFLRTTISIQDSRARKDMKENFYHGLLLGLFRANSEWEIFSNVEAGDGFADIIIEPEDPNTGIIIEAKYASSFEKLDEMCDEAVKQIKDRRYDEFLRNDGRENILAYGIAFCKKKCRVIAENISGK